MPIPTGTFIGPYEILGWLGAGGMGEVYRARDPRLGRDVAIKLIRETLATDRSRLHRFEQEARAAGQLNHPNILAVYDIGTHADAPYIVSELLEGASLRARLQNGALVSRKATDYARQMAEGLAAAHDKGIVHRDLKPDNLFITSDGRLKILDFGIAKLTRPSDEASRRTGLPTETAEGLVLGTTGYMSPEQVRGEEVDARSDLFSFGAILSEMLSGRAAFIRATAAETMAAILKEDPPEVSSATVSPALERIVSRCLEKARDARFQSARDLAFALEGLSGTAGTAARAAAVAGPRRWRTAVGVVVLCLLMALAGWLIRYTTSGPAEDAFFKATFTLLTDWEGTEGTAEISQDGKFVAFLADKTGRLNLWWSQIGGRPTNLTPNGQAYGAPAIIRHDGFSGDGTEAWFSTKRGPEDVLMIMHVTGDSPRPFLGKNAQGPAWSRDNRHLVFFSNVDGDPLYLADNQGNNAQPITIEPADPRDWYGVGNLNEIKVHNHNPVWSTDDKWIYFVHGLVYELNWTDEMDVWRIRPSGGAPERLTRHGTAVTFIAPLDERTLLYIARAEDGSGPWVWELDVESQMTRRLSTGLEQYTSVAASADGKSVVATRANPTASLWTVPIPILGRQSVEGDVRPYDVQRTRALAPRFGATEASLFFLSSRGIGDELWRFQNGVASEIRRFTDAALSEPPAVSPDGRHLVLAVRQSGQQHLVIMSADGTESRPLAPSIETHGTADWSPEPDATWVVTGGRDAQGPALFKIPVAGGAPVRIIPGPFLSPQWSPDGTLIVCSGPVVAGGSALLGVRPDGTPVELPNVIIRPNGYRFLPNGRGLVYQKERDFWLLDLVTKDSRQLTGLDNRDRLYWFDITPDSTRIVFDRARENSDVVLIERPKKQDVP